MTDEKKPSLYERLYGDEQATRESIAETFAKEERSKAVFKLKMAGHKQIEAGQIVDAGCDIAKAVEMTNAGKSKEEIISALKKNDGGIAPSP